MSDPNILVKSNEELHRIMEKVDQHLDNLGREIGDIKEKYETIKPDAIKERLDLLEKSTEGWTAIRERLDKLDSVLPKGGKFYFPHDGSEPKREVRQEMARMFLDAMAIACNRRPRFSSEYFKRFDGTQADISQTVSDLTEGGYLVPDEFRQEILRIEESYGFVARNFRRIQIARNQMHLPTHASGPAVEWVDEAEGPTADTKVTFGRITLNTKRLMATDTLSIEIMEESIPTIADFLIDVFGEKLAQEKDRVGLKGDTTANPTTDPFDGVLTDAGNNVDMSSGNTSFANLTYENLIDLMDAVNEFVANRSMFVFSNHVANIIRKIRAGTYAGGDTTQVKFGDVGIPLWVEMSQGNPRTLFGRPYEVSPVMPKAADDAVSTAFIAYGDFRNAIQADRMNTSVAFSEHADFKRGNIVMRVMERVGFKVALPDAFATLTTAAS